MRRKCAVKAPRSTANSRTRITTLYEWRPAGLHEKPCYTLREEITSSLISLPFANYTQFLCVSHSLNAGTQCLHFEVDPLVAAVDLLDILDDALAAGTEGGDEQGHPGTDVGTVECLAM